MYRYLIVICLNRYFIFLGDFIPIFTTFQSLCYKSNQPYLSSIYN